MATDGSVQERLERQLRELHLPTGRAGYAALAREAGREGVGYEYYLQEMCEREGQGGQGERMQRQLRELHLPTVRASYAALARQAEREALSYEYYLQELCERECQGRQGKRIERLLRQSRLPLEKELATFDLKRLPAKVARQVQGL